METALSRRAFLRRAGCTAIVAPLIPGPKLLGAAPASQRIALACIGVGNQGGHDTRMFLADPRVQIVASCDVDLARAKAMAATIQEQYGKNSSTGSYKGVAITQDFRELIARDDIDAVMIATPDHTHAVIAIAAARSGKDVYCEKPLAYSVREGRAIVETVTRLGRVLQTGTQRRSIAMFRNACELIRNGRIGKLHTVRIGPSRGFTVRGGYTGQEPPQPVPPDFNYDLWLGPAPWVPYTPARCHINFRWILDYGEGYISDNGVHFVDLGMWAMGTDDTGPLLIDGKAVFPATGIYDAATDFDINYLFPNGVRMNLASAADFGVRFEGSEGWMHLSGWAVSASDDKLLTSKILPHETRLRNGSAHHADFIDCVLSRRLPAAHAEIGQRTATVCHLGAISARLGRPLRWDPVREIFPDDPAANRLLWRAMRSPWSV